MPSFPRHVRPTRFLLLAAPLALLCCGGEIAGRTVDVDSGAKPVHVDASPPQPTPSQPMPVQPGPGPEPVPLPEPVDASIIIPTAPSPCPEVPMVNQGGACNLFGATCPGIEGECQATCTCTGGTWSCEDPVCGAPQPSDPCAVNGPCAVEDLGTTCKLRGHGPCGSDVKLVCVHDLWTVQSFPCDGVGQCGFGGDGCNETCSCTNGSMVCAGNCPDGGIGSP